MISRTSIGRSFGGLVRYQFEGHKGQEADKRAEVLAAVGVRADSAAHMIADFNRGRRLNSELGRAVWHTSLSFNPDDAAKLTGEKMLAVAEDYVKGMGLDQTQYAIIRHRDRPGHEHLHIIANRVANDGHTVDDGNNFYRSKELLAHLVRQHELTPPQGLRPEKQRAQHLAGAELSKHEIRQALGAALATATSGAQLREQLAAEGITWRVFRNTAGQATGVSFAKDGHTFKGSAVERQYSLAGIEKQVQANQATQAAEQARQATQRVAQEAERQASAQRAVQAQQEAERQAAATPRETVATVEQKWAAAYQQYAQQQQAHNAAVQRHNAPVQQVVQLFAQGPTVEGLQTAVQLTAGAPVYQNLHQALTDVLQKQTRHLDNVQKYAAERVELEKQVGGFLGLGLGKKAEEAREKLEILRNPPHTLPDKHYTWALYARMASEPAPKVELQPANFLRAEVPVLSLRDYAAQREAQAQAQRQAVVQLGNPAHAAQVRELLRVNGASVGDPQTGPQGVQLVVAYSMQDPKLKTISWALDQVEKRQLGMVAETAAERAERQAPGQREAQAQAQQVRRPERGRGGAELGG